MGLARCNRCVAMGVLGTGAIGETPPPRSQRPPIDTGLRAIAGVKAGGKCRRRLRPNEAAAVKQLDVLRVTLPPGAYMSHMRIDIPERTQSKVSAGRLSLT